jgi:excisionase family DNA binding protein
MEGSEQLSLPLFGTTGDQLPRVRRRPSAHVTDEKPAVVASRSLTHPVEAQAQHGHREAAVAGLLTTAEAAAVLHVHPRTVQRLVERSQLEAIHLGAAVRFDPQDVADSPHG